MIELKNSAATQGIKLEGHETHKNKWDQKFGVTSLAPMFQEGIITLPFGDDEAISKSILYTKQLHTLPLKDRVLVGQLHQM